MNHDRTVLILDHSASARTRPCYTQSGKGVELDPSTTWSSVRKSARISFMPELTTTRYPSTDSLEDDEFTLEPCSMWVSFVHAALHYARLSLELAPVGQKTQVRSSMHDGTLVSF